MENLQSEFRVTAENFGIEILNITLTKWAIYLMCSAICP